MSWWAVPLNCCASLDIFSALSSNRFNLSPRSTISMWARLTSFEAEVARVPSSWMFELGPAINFATERLGLPLAFSPTVVDSLMRFNLIQLISNEVWRSGWQTYIIPLDLCFLFRHQKVLWRNFPSVVLASRIEDKVRPAYRYSFDWFFGLRIISLIN